MRSGYDVLLQSLAAGAQILTVNDVKIEVRNCMDRQAGTIDPRTARVSNATRESFRANKADFDAEFFMVHLIALVMPRKQRT